MRKKDLLKQLEAQGARIAHLEQCVETQDHLIEGYQGREKAIIAALTNANETSARIIEEAEQRAAKLTGDAAKQAESRLSAAAQKADALVGEAERRASERERAARAECTRRLAETEATVAEYRSAIEQYNAALEYAAAEAAANAERFASFAKGRKLSPGEIAQERASLSDLAFAKPIPLPDVSDNPAQLMRNIYRIQQRELPDEAADAPAPVPYVPRAAQDAAPDGTETPTPEPPQEAPAADAVQDCAAPAAVTARESGQDAAPAAAEPPLTPEPAPEPEPEAPAQEPEPETAIEFEPETEPAADEPEPDLAGLADEILAEAAPEEDALRTVRGVLEGRDPNQSEQEELSLDALLDEIIKSGEQNNG